MKAEPMNSDDSAEKIRQRMAELRRELDLDMGKVSRSARAMTDWTFYVRRFPWATAGVAALAGYLLIPKKKQKVAPDPDALAELVKKGRVQVAPASMRAETQTLIKSLLITGAGLVAKAALNHAVQSFQRPKPEPPHDESRPPAPSPLEEPWPQ